MEAQPQQDPYAAYHKAAGRGIEYHIHGDFSRALGAACEAHRALTGQKIDPEQGLDIAAIREAVARLVDPGAQNLGAQNLRNIGVRSARVAPGDGEARTEAIEQAIAALRASADIHNTLFDTQKTPDLKREAAVTAMYLGTIAMQELIRQERSGQGASDEQRHAVLGPMRESREGLKRAAEIDGQTHQYLINAMGRFAMAEALYGKRTRGLALGMKATWLAFFSERERPLRERGTAVVKGLVRGLGAIAANLVAGVGLRAPARKLVEKAS